MAQATRTRPPARNWSNKQNGFPACLVCHYPSTRILKTGIREKTEAPVYKCPRCLLQFIEPPQIDLREYYRRDYRREHDCVIGQQMTPEERFLELRPSMAEPAGRFAKFVPQGATVLEIGCSSGYFLDALKQHGYEVFGAEWNPEDAAFVRDVGEIPCEEGELKDIYPGRKFTAIAALGVLEHQKDPLAFLRECKQKLIGGGYLYLEMPNNQEALLTVYNVPEYTQRYYRNCHITYWQPETLASVLGALGFEAQVTQRQRYGLANHINWVLHHKPMERYRQGTDYFSLSVPSHPAHAILFRTTVKLDREYRLQLETLKAADTIVATCRLRYI